MASRCTSALRTLPRTRSPALRHRSPLQARWLAAAATTASTSAPPPPPPAPRPSDPKIGQLVDDISGLTLLQAADLVTLLKTRLNIQEIAMPSAAPAVAAAPAETEAPAEEKPKEKTIFNVKLEAFNTSAKPKIIREVKALIPNLNLMEAKKFVESVPKVLKEGLSKEEAEKMKAAFEALGATVTLE